MPRIIGVSMTRPFLRRSIVIAGPHVMVWQSDETTPVALPVVVFSHGFHGYPTQSRFLMTVLAAAGYLVFAPTTVTLPAMAAAPGASIGRSNALLSQQLGTRRAFATVPTILSRR
jgi:dienelactone hydrolase